MKRIMGFGTRNVTDNIIRPFVNNAKTRSSTTLFKNKISIFQYES